MKPIFLCLLTGSIVFVILSGCAAPRYYWENTEKTKCKDRKSGLYVLPENCHAQR